MAHSYQAEQREIKKGPALLKRRHRDWIAGYLFLAPNLVTIGVFTVLPLIAGLIISLTNWDLLSDPEWVGMQNYRDMADDPILLQSIWVTFLYSIIVIPGGILISMAIALSLNARIRAVRFYQAVFFLPYVSSTVAVALVWKWLFNPDYGMLNALLRTFGLPTPDWLTNPSIAIISVAIVTIWQTAGYNAILLLAGLKSIPGHYYEAAKLDGASSWQQFSKITLPLLKPTIFFVVVTSLINSFLQSFNIIYVLTAGGPDNSTKVIMFYIWESAFSFFKMGYASAISYVLCLLLVLVMLMQNRFLGRDATEMR